MAAKGKANERLLIALKEGATFSVEKSFTADGDNSRRELKKNDTVEYAGEPVTHVATNELLPFKLHPKHAPTACIKVYLNVAQINGMLTT